MEMLTLYLKEHGPSQAAFAAQVILLTPGARYRIAQVGTITPAAPAANVTEAVRALALYQLIHSVARRELRTMNAGAVPSPARH